MDNNSFALGLVLSAILFSCRDVFYAIRQFSHFVSDKVEAYYWTSVEGSLLYKDVISSRLYKFLFSWKFFTK